MFDHIGVSATDLPAADRFYTTVLEAAGIAPATRGTYVEWDDFALGAASADHPPTRGLHLAFSVASRGHVDAFWAAGRAAGHPDAGAPGERPQYLPGYYGAFLRDPDGNSVEAVHREGRRADGNVDHLWLGVADLDAAAAFYEVLAPHAGFRPGTRTRERAGFDATGPGGGSFSVVPGREPTSGVHLAFRAPDTASVDRFHAAALAAGCADNGAPGLRPAYSPGYYAAFVLDPDGTNVEAVHHG